MYIYFSSDQCAWIFLRFCLFLNQIYLLEKCDNVKELSVELGDKFVSFIVSPLHSNIIVETLYV